MRSWANWNKLALAGALCAACGVAAFNVVMDPYSVLGTAEWMRQGFNVNERYRKVEHLRKSPTLHDSFFLGSSTMGLYDVEPANKARPGSSWYNLSFLAGTPPEALRTLKYLKSQGSQINEVMFGIDIFAFRKVEGSRDLWKREHPLVRGESWWSWYKAHVFASSFLIGVDKVMHQLSAEPTMRFDVETTGRYHLLEWDRESKLDEQGFIQKKIYDPLKKRGNTIEASGLVLIQERFDELRELKTWLESEGIKSHFWINPMHWATLESIEAQSLDEFRRKIRESIGDVADYSAREDITKDDRAFYELKHYKAKTAALITNEILSADGRSVGREAVASGDTAMR